MTEQTEICLSDIPIVEKQKGGNLVKSNKRDVLPLVLCIGDVIPILHPDSASTSVREFFVVYVRDVTSIEPILSKDAVDLVIFSSPNFEALLSSIEQCKKRHTLEKIPVVTFSEELTEKQCFTLFEYGVIDIFHGQYSSEFVVRKLNQLVRLYKATLGDTHELHEVKSRQQHLQKKIENSETEVQSLLRKLRFEKLKSRELEQVNFVVNRCLSTISAGNFAMVAASSERELAQSMCDVLVKHAQYTQAWVGFLDADDSSSLNVVAHASSDGKSIPIALHCEGSRFGCHSVTRAIESRVTVVNSSISNKASCEACWDVATEHDYNSIVSLPLKDENRTIGILNVKAKSGNSIEFDEMTMLEEVAGDLAFGILSHRSRNERDRLFNALNEMNSDLESKIRSRTRELELANHKLKELDTLKSLFIASVSHELRTPLNSIIGFTGILLKGLSGELNERQRDQLTRVNRSSKQLLELIINVIDIAKIEGHRIEIFPAEFSSRSVVNEVMAEFKEAAEKKGISLQLKGEEDIYLYSDRKRFAQCVHNLVSNAVKYTEKGGVEIVQLKKGKNIELSVVDTGIGIAPDEISTCFQAFERLPTHLKVKAGGAGLGLYLTKKISTEVLHGGLTVESKVNKGSCFTITVPCELELES